MAVIDGMSEEPFIAPATFAEYIERFGDYHKKWLRTHHGTIRDIDDFDDACQHLLLETLRKRRVERYDSLKRRNQGQKDTPGLFLSYLGTCFRNDMRTRFTHARARVRRVNEGATSLTDYLDKPDHLVNDAKGVRDDEGLAFASQHYAKRAEREGELIVVKAQIAQFRAFIEKYRPDLLPALNNVGAASIPERSALAGLADRLAGGKTPRHRYPNTRRHKHNFTAEEVLAVARQGLTIREAKVALGCSHQTLQITSRRLFNMSWKMLVVVQKSVAVHGKAADA